MSKKKKGKSIPPKGPLEWIYEIDGDKGMRDLYREMADGTGYKVEYWEEAGVLEISFAEIGGIDMEQSEEEDVLWVTVSPKDYDGAMAAMKEIEKVCGGKFSL